MARVKVGSIATLIIGMLLQQHMICAAPVQEQPRKMVFAEIKIPTTSAYVHEGIPYTVYFYYTDDAVNQVTMQPWSVTHARQITAATIERGTTTVRDMRCNYAAWSGVLYPEKSGHLIIPPIYFEYTEPAGAGSLQQHWAQFMHLFTPISMQKQMRTQHTTLTVHALPPTQETITGVGSITSVQAICSSDTVQQGESIVCTVTIEGSFDAQALQLPPLMVPDTMRVYESKITTTGVYPQLKKSYEYIVQGLTAGTTALPSQRYIFFDPHSETYKTYTTPAMPLYIMPSAQQQQRVDAVQPATEEAVVEPVESAGQPQQASATSFLLPLWLYLVLIAIPVLWIALRRYWYRWHAQVRLLRVRRKAFRTVRKELHAAAHQHDASIYLHIWRNFLQNVIPTQYLIEDASGITYLLFLGASDAEVKQWRALYEAFIEQRFAATRGQSVQHVIEQADAAVTLLQQKMRQRGEL